MAREAPRPIAKGHSPERITFNSRGGNAQPPHPIPTDRDTRRLWFAAGNPLAKRATDTPFQNIQRSRSSPRACSSCADARLARSPDMRRDQGPFGVGQIGRAAKSFAFMTGSGSSMST